MTTTLKTGLFSNVHTVLTVLIAAKRLTSGQLGVAVALAVDFCVLWTTGTFGWLRADASLWCSMPTIKCLLTTQVVRSRWWHGSYSPFLRYCAVRDMDVMIIEVPEPTGFSAGLVYLVLSPLVLSFLWWFAL